LKPRLEDVLLRRDAGQSQTEFASLDWALITLRDNRIYEHKTLRARYATYDACDEEDIIRVSGPKTHIMILNPAYSSDIAAHPFLYARVHGIYHANIVYKGGTRDSEAVRLEFLWVRWFRWEGRSASSYGLHVLTFPHVTENGAFGFIDPTDILRGCHIVPGSSPDEVTVHGNLSGVARDSEDSKAYFVNPSAFYLYFLRSLADRCTSFPDRDMYMRYQWGRAIGHEYSHTSGRYQQTLAEFYAANPLAVQDTRPPPALSSSSEPVRSSSRPDNAQPSGPARPTVSEVQNEATNNFEGDEELGEAQMVYREFGDDIASDDEGE
jgi:hypothetical protein